MKLASDLVSTIICYMNVYLKRGDYATCQAILKVLDAILNLDGYTRVIVTHDLGESILRRCTRLFVLKNGEVLEQGTSGKLMAQKGYFYLPEII